MKPKDNTSMRGIVHANKGREKFRLSRFLPCPELQPFVEHYWLVAYHLPAGETFTQTVLSYPNLHLAFEEDEEGRRGLLYGVPSRPFVRALRGEGLVLGIKFRAGGCHPFYPRDAALLTGTVIPASEAFGSEAEDWVGAVLDAGDDEAMAKAAENLLLIRLPKRDETAELANAIVQSIMDDRDVITVEQMSEQSRLSVRQLQRLFRKYVGVSPKWVIKRFRLQEAAARMEAEKELSWTQLAEQLGYFDQAHFIKDFKSVLGLSPSEYRTRPKG